MHFLLLIPLFFILTHAGLKDFCVPHEMYVGTAVRASLLQTPYTDPAFVKVLTREYNMVTAGNAMKWATTQPSKNVFDFTQADALVSYARSTCKAVRGHNLLWGSYNPSWLTSGRFSSSQLRALLITHIQTVMTHYKGKITYWDVVNEIINTGPGVWAPLGTAYEISALALRTAHAVDPSAKLCINEYNMERAAASTGTYTLVKALLAGGIPLHCVGFQGHVVNDVSFTTWQKSLKVFTDLGLEVQITEFDIPNASATAYTNGINACINNSKCTAFISWGLTDRYTWLGTAKAPLPFDVNYNPKPAYYALRTALNASCAKCRPRAM